MKLATILLLAGVATMASAQNANDYSPQKSDTEIGALRIEHIKQRLAASSCPWTADADVQEWWGGEQPGVEIRKYEKDYSAHTGVRDKDGNERILQNFVWKGHPIANFHQGPYTAGGNAINDASFTAHACEDIKYLLDKLESKP